jgi:hypothetical protein
LFRENISYGAIAMAIITAIGPVAMAAAAAISFAWMRQGSANEANPQKIARTQIGSAINKTPEKMARPSPNLIPATMPAVKAANNT